MSVVAHPLGLRIISFVCLAVFLFVPPIQAQQKFVIPEYLDVNTTAVLRIDNIPRTYDRIKSLDIFSNPLLIKAIESLSDERFPAVQRERAEAVWDAMAETEGLIHQIEGLTFVVHEWTDDRFRWSLFLRSSPETMDRLQNSFLKIVHHLTNASQPIEEKRGFDSTDLSTDDDNLNGRDANIASARRARGLFIVSNHFEFLDDFGKRKPEGFESLADARKFQAIMSRTSKLKVKRSDGHISIYGNPIGLRKLFSYPQSNWNSFRLEEMPSCGFNFVIPKPSSNKDQPTVVAEAVIKRTFPHVGISKMYSSYRPVTIPPIFVEPIELRCYAANEEQRYREADICYDMEYGDNASRDWYAAHYEGSGRDFWRDAVPRRSAYYSIQFVDADHGALRPGSLTLEKIKDAEAMKRYVEGTILQAKQKFKRQFNRTEPNGDILWQIPEDQSKKNAGSAFHVDKRAARLYTDNYHEDAYMLTDGWYVRGDQPAVEDQVNLLKDTGGIDYGSQLQKMVDDLMERAGGKGKPFSIKYYRPESWLSKIWETELKYHERRNPTIAAHLGSTRNSYDEILREADLTSFNALTAEPNEDGYRTVVRNRDDLVCAAQTMIGKAFADSFGRQLFVLTQSQSQIRVMFGVYPLTDK